jgi:hypothetical protein
MKTIGPQGSTVLALVSLALLSAWAAQAAPRSGTYEIQSGTFYECCGLIGVPVSTVLPNAQQAFIRLQVDSAGATASLAILGADNQTVFQKFTCPPAPGVSFSFSHGQVYADHIAFPAEPSPAPISPLMGTAYTASNMPNLLTLRIDGELHAQPGFCSDVPTEFTHSNVVARYIPGPRLTMVEPATNGAVRIMVQGQAGWTDIIDASTDLQTWTPVSTNVMDFSLCPICPFAVFEDPDSTHLPYRFYRARELR